MSYQIRATNTCLKPQTCTWSFRCMVPRVLLSDDVLDKGASFKRSSLVIPPFFTSPCLIKCSLFVVTSTSWTDMRCLCLVIPASQKFADPAVCFSFMALLLICLSRCHGVCLPVNSCSYAAVKNLCALVLIVYYVLAVTGLFFLLAHAVWCLLDTSEIWILMFSFWQTVL